jgi:DNA-binding IclR family transcriptional regulator
VVRLHSTYIKSASYPAQVMPILHDLVAATGESAAFHARQGPHRLCLARVDSPHPVRDNIQVGDLLPLEEGAGGRVLHAYSEPQDQSPDLQIRCAGVFVHDDQESETAAIAAPVFGPSDRLLGVIELSMPSARLRPTWADAVRTAAQTLSKHLGGNSRLPPKAQSPLASAAQLQIA